jgi:SAM-dependent methyltransferase
MPVRKPFTFKLVDYDDNYYRIYEKVGTVTLDKIPSFRLIKRFLSVESEDWVLDAGCGAGHLLEYVVAESNASGVGMDFSSPAMRLAKVASPRSLFIKQDLTAIGFKEGVFEKILCFNVIEHIADQEKVLWELDRILKPNGLLVIGTNIKDSLAWRLYQRFIGDHTHVKEFTVKEFLDFIGRTFQIIDYRRSSGVFRFRPPISWIFHHVLLGDIIVLCKKIPKISR